VIRGEGLCFEPVSVADATAIAELSLRIFHQCYLPDVLTQDEVEYFWSRVYSPEVLAERIAGGGTFEWVVLDGVRAGFLAFRAEPDQYCLRLEKLYLLPELQGRGLGASALARVKAAAQRMGLDVIQLYVFRKNQRAIRAYQRSGFVVERAEVTECSNGFRYDDYLMTHRCWPGRVDAPGG
jgi:ribosomal protein S18 acetylase RimI-like enzyme